MSVALLLLVTGTLRVDAQTRLHAHGVAELNLAFDGRTGLLEFTAPRADRLVSQAQVVFTAPAGVLA